MKTKFKHKTIAAPFYVVDVNNTKPPMGLNVCLALNILTINTVESNNRSKDNNILEQYDNIFKGLGKADWEYTIKLSENAKPTIHSPTESTINSFVKIKRNIRSFRKCRCRN